MGVRKLPRAVFPGAGAGGTAAAAQEHPGPSCLTCSGPCACAGHCCSHHPPQGRKKLPSGIPSRQPSSHHTCHLSHSTSLVSANTCLLHMLPFAIYFPPGSAPTSEFSTADLGVALHLCFKMSNCSSTSSYWGLRQGCWQAWGTSPYSCPQLLVPAFSEYWHWGACVQPPG